MPLLKNLANSKPRMYLTEEDDDQRKLNAKDRDKKECEYFERQKKKREEARKLATERTQKLKEERQAREKAEAEAKAKAEAARKKAAESQAAKTAKERDAEERKFFENKNTVTPIKAMHQAGKTGAAQSTDTDTGEYKAKKVPTSSNYAKEIAWREEQDEMVYEDRKSIRNLTTENKGRGFSGGGSSSWSDIYKGTQPDSFNKFLNGEKQFDIEEGTIIGLLEKPKTREQLQTKYNSVASQNDSGTYYEDISFTGGQGLIGERGVTYVVNLDEGWAAQYKHRGAGIGASVLPLDVQYTRGKVVDGDISDPEHYTKLFYQQTGGPVVGKDDAWGLFSDTKIKQTGTSLMPNVGIGGTLSYYDLVTVEYFDRNDN